VKVYQAYFVSGDGLAKPIPQIDGDQAEALAACARWRDFPCFIVCADVPPCRRGDVPAVVVADNNAVTGSEARQ